MDKQQEAKVDYKVKGEARARKVAKRRNAMPDDNRGSIATIQRVMVKRGREAAAKLAGPSK